MSPWELTGAVLSWVLWVMLPDSLAVLDVWSWVLEGGLLSRGQTVSDQDRRKWEERRLETGTERNGLLAEMDACVRPSGQQGCWVDGSNGRTQVDGRPQIPFPVSECVRFLRQCRRNKDRQEPSLPADGITVKGETPLEAELSAGEKRWLQPFIGMGWGSEIVLAYGPGCLKPLLIVGHEREAGTCSLF